MSHEYLEVKGHRLECARDGPHPDIAPTLVFLHEGLGCVEMWRDFPAKLSAATGCGAFVYSRLGYGRSDPCALPRPVRFMHEEGLEVLPELLNVAGIQDCILVGHSDGGSISIIYSGGTPARPLRGLITEAAHVFCEDVSTESVLGANHAYRDGDLRKKLEKYHGNNTHCAFWGWNGAWLHEDFAHWNLEEYLPRIRVPMLAIQGEDDRYGTGAQTDAIARQAGAGAEVLMLPNCGHSPHRDREEETLEAMRSYIREVIKG